MCRHLTNYGRNVAKALEERSEHHFLTMGGNEGSEGEPGPGSGPSCVGALPQAHAASLLPPPLPLPPTVPTVLPRPVLQASHLLLGATTAVSPLPLCLAPGPHGSMNWPAPTWHGFLHTLCCQPSQPPFLAWKSRQSLQPPPAHGTAFAPFSVPVPPRLQYVPYC